MAAAQSKQDGRDLVAEAARRAYDDAGGDVAKAVAMLEQAVRQSRALRDALTEPLIASACYDAVRTQVRVERRSVWRPPTVAPVTSPARPHQGPNRAAPASSPARSQPVADPTPDAARVVQLAAGTLLMFPLPGGKRLAEATREEIAAAAEFYERQAGDMATKGRWLRLVAQSIPGKKTVGDVLTDQRLRDLQEEARRG